MNGYLYNLGLRFQETVRQYQNRTALQFTESDTVSYDLLNRRANAVSHYLVDRGLQPGDLICISGTKSLDTYALMLGCLKIGVAYVMLDPDSPVERLRRIVQTCQPRAIVMEPDFEQRTRELAEGLPADRVQKDTPEFSEQLNRYSDQDPPCAETPTGSNPAYVMYTSGSTGVPKGAVMTHANVMNLIDWSRTTYNITPDDVLTNVNPLYFDNSVFDFYSALFNGATLVPFTKDEVRDPGLLVEKIDTLKCSLWFSVPSLLIFLQTMRATDGKRLRSIRRFIFGGEGYPKAKLKLLYHAYKETAELHNVYGPTECTCICSSYQLSEDDFIDVQDLPPLGKIAPNFSFLILDEQDQTVAPGDVGELCLLGPQVGKGYYGDPERTATSFVANPCNRRFHETMYRTGDVVRLDPSDGKLYIHGRKDNQIKHMGYRIELEEIEAALHCLEYVNEAAALHMNQHGQSQIIAVVASGCDFTDDQIRVDLRQRIPDYMLPSHFHREPVLPKNANGKVDRRALAKRYT